MQKTPLVSIIIPIYNCERYLEDCLRSIRGQTYQHTEVILIDDGSTDRSADLLKAYEDLPRWTIIHQPNAGRSVARNVGIEHAQGDWMMFVDADDILHPDAIRILADHTREDIDVVLGKIVKFSHCVEEVSNRSGAFTEQLNRAQLLDYLLLDPEDETEGNCYIARGPVIRLYSRTFRKIRFVPGQEYGEDFLYSTKVFLKTTKAIYDASAIYYYRNDEMSSSGRTRNYEKIALQTANVISLIVAELTKAKVNSELCGYPERYLRYGYYHMLNLYCQCIEFHLEEAAEKIKQSDLKNLQIQIRHSNDRLEKLPVTANLKFGLALYFPRLYAELYRRIRRHP